MVQLFPVKSTDATALSELTEERDGRPSAGSPQDPTTLHLALNPSAKTYHGYETYIEDGLICLRHKIRNLEKKKLKLEDYQTRLTNGKALNQDQLDAVGRYEEVVHNLTFAKELQKTIGALTQDLLDVQKTAVRKEQIQRAEKEQSRLSMMLQMQYVLCSLQRPDLRKTFSTREYTRYLSAQEVEKLLKLASLLACKRDESKSLEDQMEQASVVYLDLLNGKDQPVAGSTYKYLKEKLLRLVDSGLFDRIPEPEKEPEKDRKPTPEPSVKSLPAGVDLVSVNGAPRQFLNRRYITGGDPTGLSLGPSKDTKVHPPTWKAELLALKEQEPPDSWDMEFTATPASSETVLPKPWNGAAGFIPKAMVTIKSAAESKQKRQKKTKGSQDSKTVTKAEPVEVFNSPSSLAKDPALRRQQLDRLMDQITGSFSFIQDSLLDGAMMPVNGCSRAPCPSPGSAPLAPKDPNILPADILPPSQNSTPIHGHQRSGDAQIPLVKGEQLTNTSALKLPIVDGRLGSVSELKVNEVKQEKDYTSPPLYCRESNTAVPRENETAKQAVKQLLTNGDVSPNVLAQTFSTPPSRRSLPATSTVSFGGLHSVFNREVPLTRSSVPKIDESGFLGSACLSYCTASTQTPPELSLPQDDLQMESAYLSESDISATSHVYSSPGQNSAPPSSLVQNCYPHSTLGGMMHGARGLSHSIHSSPKASRGGYEMHRVNLRAPGSGFSAKTHREPGPVLYNPQENGYQQIHKRAGGTAAQRNGSIAGWSDSSQISSPDREGTYIIGSTHGDSLSVMASGMSLAGPPPHALMSVYPQIRVAFSAARATNLAPGTLDQPIAFDLLQSNLGGAFDAQSGHFSCPAAGMYVFFFHILKLAISVPLYVNLMRNDDVIASAYANDGAPDHETASNHAVLPLRVGDHVWLRLHRGAIYGSTWKYSTFSGFLLYPD